MHQTAKGLAALGVRQGCDCGAWEEHNNGVTLYGILARRSVHDVYPPAAAACLCPCWIMIRTNCLSLLS